MFFPGLGKRLSKLIDSLLEYILNVFCTFLRSLLSCDLFTSLDNWIVTPEWSRARLLPGMRDARDAGRDAGRCIRELLAALRQVPLPPGRGLLPALGSGGDGLQGEAARTGKMGSSIPRILRESRTTEAARRRPQDMGGP